MGLASHLNVFNSCLRILRAKGYELSVSGERTPDGGLPYEAHWIAERDGFYFCGDNPIELLGLVAIYDHVQPAADEPYWWRVHDSDEDLWAELLETLPPRSETDHDE